MLRVSGSHVCCHHMIMVKVLSWNKLCIIHYSKTSGGRATISKEDVVVDPSNDVIYRIDYDSDKLYTGQEATDRALERVGECSYSLLFKLHVGEGQQEQVSSG